MSNADRARRDVGAMRRRMEGRMAGERWSEDGWRTGEVLAVEFRLV